MAGNTEPSGLIHHQFPTAVVGLFLAVGGAQLTEPLLTISENSKSISILIAIYAFLYLFVPFTFSLNMILLLSHVATCVRGVGAPVGPLHFLFLIYLCRAAQTVSVASLLLGFPLLLHVAPADDSGSLGTGPGLVCLDLVSVLISSFSHTSTRFGPTLFALCTSTSLLPFADLLLSFANQNQCDRIICILIHILSFFLIPFTFMHGIILLILHVAAPPDEKHATTRAKHLVTVGTLSAACTTLLVGMYTMAHVAVTDMGVIGG